MSATLAPFGLRPAFHPSGLDRAVALPGGITSGYASALLKGQPVAYGTGAADGTIVAAGATGAFIGAFAGVEWTDTTGRHRVSNYWPAGTTYIAGSCVAYFYRDPAIEYEIQADGTLAQTAIGNEYDFTNVTAGSTTTGLSQATLGVATAAGNGVQAQMRVVGLAPYPGNNWGDAYTIVRVQIAQNQFYGSVTAIA